LAKSNGRFMIINCGPSA